MNWYRWKWWRLAYAPESVSIVLLAAGHQWRRWRFGLYLRGRRL